MRTELRDLCSPKNKNEARYFMILPNINVVKHFGLWNIYLGWFNWCLVIKLY